MLEQVRRVPGRCAHRSKMEEVRAARQRAHSRSRYLSRSKHTMTSHTQLQHMGDNMLLQIRERGCTRT